MESATSQPGISRALPKLRLTRPDALTIRRRRNGRGFVYHDEHGRRVVAPDVLDRLRSLAVPPAYEDVRIAKDQRAHLQATGRDAAGRIQYRYHSAWSEVRESQKSARLAVLCEALPRIRRRVARDLRLRGVERNRVLAAVVTLIDRTHIRIGCEDYVHSARSRGAATLLKQNVERRGDELVLTFRGKGGRQIETSVKASGLLRLYPALMRLPGRRFFQYRDSDGAVRKVNAAQVNAYLTEIAGTGISAKDFRTLAATSLAASRLAEVEPASSKRARRAQIAAVMNEIADRLCNTPTVVRRSYVHDRLIEAFESGKLQSIGKKVRRQRSRSRAESIVAALFPQSSSKL
jgi:DNA topoisomerase-1